MRFVVFLTLAACGSGSPVAPQPSHDHRAGMVHDFHDARRWAKVFDDPARDAWQKPAEVVRVMDVKAGMTVADLGAGTGYFEPYLARAVGDRGKVLALDVEAEMVAYLKERGGRDGWANVEARIVAADDPGLAPGTVDRVLVVDTWHHLPDRPGYARKLATALKPGGEVVIVDFTKESLMGPPVHARVAPETAIEELGAAGLLAQAIDGDSLAEQYVVVGVKR